MKERWHLISESAARELTTATNSQGIVYPISKTKLPDQIKEMTGVSSYYISGYAYPHLLSQGFTISGEMLVARSDGEITKNYNYVFACSSDGMVYFQGPYKGFGHQYRKRQKY